MYLLDASIQSFRRMNGYLLTQMPLPDTAVDFWHLVYDHKCPTIITLLEVNSQVSLYNMVVLFYVGSSSWSNLSKELPGSLDILIVCVLLHISWIRLK